MMNKPAFLSILIILIAINSYSNPSWRYYYEKGTIEYRAGMYDFAIENLIKALDRKKDLYEAANILANIYQKKSNIMKVQRYLSISLKINDKQDKIHHRIAEVYDYIGNFDLAFHHYKRSVQLNTTNTKSHLGLAKYYLSKKDKTNAEKHFAICYNLSGKDGEKLYIAALRKEQEGNDKGAIILYRSAIEKCPVLIKAYFNISEIYRRNGDLINAVRYLEQIKEIKPDYEKAYIYIANLLFNGRFPQKREHIIERAIFNLQKSIEINPKNAESYFLLSDIYYHIGKVGIALDYRKKAIEIEEMDRR